MTEMPFFKNKLEWGTSVRGAWWDDYKGIELEFTGLGCLFDGDEQITEALKLDRFQWDAFVNAMYGFWYMILLLC